MVVKKWPLSERNEAILKNELITQELVTYYLVQVLNFTLVLVFFKFIQRFNGAILWLVNDVLGDEACLTNLKMCQYNLWEVFMFQKKELSYMCINSFSTYSFVCDICWQTLMQVCQPHKSFGLYRKKYSSYLFISPMPSRKTCTQYLLVASNALLLFFGNLASVIICWSELIPTIRPPVPTKNNINLINECMLNLIAVKVSNNVAILSRKMTRSSRSSFNFKFWNDVRVQWIKSQSVLTVLSPETPAPLIVQPP